MANEWDLNEWIFVLKFTRKHSQNITSYINFIRTGISICFVPYCNPRALGSETHSDHSVNIC